MERGSPVDRENVVARENLGIAPFEVFRNVIRAIVGNGRMYPARVAEGLPVLSSVYHRASFAEEIDGSKRVPRFDAMINGSRYCAESKKDIGRSELFMLQF